MNRIKLLFVLLACWAPLLHAQTAVKITGTVLDSTDQSPVANAAVMVIGSHIGTYTDDAGRFSISDLYAGDYVLKISHIGYQEITIPVSVTTGLTTAQTILIQPRHYRSQEVLIEAERANGNLIEIGARTIESSSATSVAGLLSEISEIYVATESSSGGSQVRIRGSNANQVLVLLDGIPLNDPVTGTADLSTIPLNLLQKISIQIEGGGASAGSGTIGGVIRLETRSRTIHRLQLNSAIGTPGKYKINGVTGGEFADWGYTLFTELREEQNNFSYSYILPDGIIKERDRQNADFHSWSLHGSLSRELFSSKFNLNGFVLQSERGIPGRIFQWTPYASASDLRTGLSAGYEQRFGQTVVNADAGYAYTSSKHNNKVPENAPLQYMVVPSYHTEYIHHTINSSIRVNHSFSPIFSMHAEVDFKQTSFELTNESSGSDKKITADGLDFGQAVGVSVQLPLGSSPFSVHFQPLVRHSVAEIGSGTENLSYEYWSHSTDISLTRTGKLAGSIYVHTDRSFRIPTYSDLFHQDFRIEGNPGLRPERGTGVTVGGRLSTTGSANVSVQGDFFRKKIDDNIIWVVGSFGNFTPKNTPSEITGQSLKLQWDIGDHLFFGNIYFEHLHPLDKTPNHALYNNHLPFRPPYQLQSSFGTRLGKIEATYNHRYRSDQYSNRANTHLLSAYQVGDLEVRWNGPVRVFSSLNLRLSCRIENLWDTKFQTMERMPEPGRQYTLTVTLFNPKGDM